MGKLQEWIEEHVGVTAGAVIAACFGAGYGIGAWQRHQDKKFSQWKEKQSANMAYFMGTKDGAIKTLENLLKEQKPQDKVRKI